jgi:hypothetical protein
MPLTNELGDAVVQAVAPALLPPGGFTTVSFEGWLSRLAEDQPYLDEPANLRNRALFYELTAAIARTLGERVHTTLSEPWPTWLPALLNLSHERRAALLTFNYDTLVECAIAGGMVNEWISPDEFSWIQVVSVMPPAPGVAVFGAIETFELLKLHGSLNWYWSPKDASGLTVVARRLPGTYGAPERYEESSRQREAPGRLPLLVPPAASKSSFYSNPVVREVWQRAAAQLTTASKISLIGYSMPSTDLTFAGVLGDALRAGSCPIDVVDPSPDGIVHRLVALGIHRDRISSVGGPTAVDDFVSKWTHAHTVELEKYIQHDASEEALDSPMIVLWDLGRAAAVRSLTVTAGEVLLGISEVTSEGLAISPDFASRSALPELRDLLERSEGRHWTVRVRDEKPQVITGWRVVPAKWGRSATWNVLLPSGHAGPPQQIPA